MLPIVHGRDYNPSTITDADADPGAARDNKWNPTQGSPQPSYGHSLSPVKNRRVKLAGLLESRGLSRILRLLLFASIDWGLFPLAEEGSTLSLLHLNEHFFGRKNSRAIPKKRKFGADS